MATHTTRRSRLQKRQRKILEHYGYVRPVRRRRELPAVWVREPGRYPFVRRPRHPVVWVYQDPLTGRWRYMPPRSRSRRTARRAVRELGEALALVVASAVVFYVVLR